MRDFYKMRLIWKMETRSIRRVFIKIRVGINTGPVVAGVWGLKKFPAFEHLGRY